MVKDTPTSNPSKAAGTVHLRLMETSDLHVHIMPFDYFRDRPSHTMGLARVSTLIARCRAEVENTLLFDNGDFLQGNPVGDYIVLDRGFAKGDLHPMIAAMNRLGYDAATVGNHEFNYGLGFLEDALARAEFPVVCANVAGPGPERRAIWPAWALLERSLRDDEGAERTLTVGVLGLVPPQVMLWDRSLLEGEVSVRDMVSAAREAVPAMRAAGADVIVVLAHTGIATDAAPAGAGAVGPENAAVALAAIPGADLLLTGHTHLVFPSPTFAGVPCVDAVAGTISGKPAVMPGFWGSHLGVIDLWLVEEAAGWRIVASHAEARPISDRRADGTVRALVESDPAMMAEAHPVHTATRAYMRRTVGTSARAIHSYFALVEDCAALQVVLAAQAAHVAAALAGTEHAGLPLLSAAAPFKAGGRGGPENYTDIAPGGLMLRNVADLYAFPNSIRAVRVTGAEIAEWLEHSASLFARLGSVPGDYDLIAPDFPSYGFDVISGLTYRFDPREPQRYGIDGRLADPDAHRVRDLRHDGRPVDPEAEFVVATNNYRVNGFAGQPWAANIREVHQGSVTNRDILMRYIAARGRIEAETVPNWSFVPLPGYGLLFRSSPLACDRLRDDGTGRIRPVGPAPDGFHLFRLEG